MPRPLSLKTDVPRTRKRQKACEKEHNAEGSTFKYKKKQPKLESSADPDNDDNDRDGDADSDRLDTKINLDGSVGVCHLTSFLSPLITRKAKRKQLA